MTAQTHPPSLLAAVASLAALPMDGSIVEFPACDGKSSGQIWSRHQVPILGQLYAAEVELDYCS